MGLSTVINPQNRDATGKPLSSSMKSTIERLRTWDNRSRTYQSSNKNFRQAFSELDKLKDKLTVGDPVVEKAAYIYRKALRKAWPGAVRSLHSLHLHSMAACRFTETPRTLKDVGHASNIKRKDIARCYRLLLRELDLKMPIVDPVGVSQELQAELTCLKKQKERQQKSW